MFGLRGFFKVYKLEFSNFSLMDGLRFCMVFFYGGGMVLGIFYFGIVVVSYIVFVLGIIIFSVDYGRVFECKGIELIEDCYVVLEWVS